MTFLELNQRLPELLLMRVDKMSMARSIEARVPFLDHQLVEMALKIPSALKYRDGETKYVLKRAAEGILPREVIYRQKAGFCGSSRNMLSPRLLRFLARCLPDASIIRDSSTHRCSVAPDDQREGRADNSFKIWNLLNLALWHQHWFEASLTPCVLPSSHKGPSLMTGGSPARRLLGLHTRAAVLRSEQIGFFLQRPVASPGEGTSASRLVVSGGSDHRS